MPANPSPDTPALRDASRPSVALVTGITGQDGGYLTALLLSRGYEVHGLARDPARLDRSRLAGTGADLNRRLVLHRCDIGTEDDMDGLLARIVPDEVYNLAAQTHIQTSFKDPAATTNVNATGAVKLLSAVSRLGRGHVRYFQASSSEMFGDACGRVQNEETPLHPLNPYAVSKHAAFEATVNFREAYRLHTSNGILFNHESPFRAPSFVTRKISQSVAASHVFGPETLRLGNLDVRRDWGHARDYVEGMWKMLQQDTPDDYVLASGKNHSVREFVEIAFSEIGRSISWEGEGVEEKGFDAATGELLVEVDPAFFRPTDLSATLGDARKAREKLGWCPKASFRDLVAEMVAADIARAEEQARAGAGVSGSSD